MIMCLLRERIKLWRRVLARQPQERVPECFSEVRDAHVLFPCYTVYRVAESEVPSYQNFTEGFPKVPLHMDVNSKPIGRPQCTRFLNHPVAKRKQKIACFYLRFGCCCRKIMFSVVSVCLSIILSVKRRVPMWPLPMMPLVSHRSYGTPGHAQTFSLGEVSGPSPGPGPVSLLPPALALLPTHMGTPPTLTPKTCSNLFIMYPSHLLASGWLALDWKALLLFCDVISDVPFLFKSISLDQTHSATLSY